MCQIQFKMDIPVEIQEKILWYLRFDTVTMHRVEKVCLLWSEIVGFFEKYKSLRFRSTKVLFFSVSFLKSKFGNLE